jgi:hypothetical protein
MTTLQAIGLTDIYSLLGHLSYLLAAMSFLLRDILKLRVMAICAALANIAFAYNGELGPNWIPVFWQAVLAAINIVWSFKLIRERRGVSFTPEERELHETRFQAFSPVEFMKLMRVAQWSRADSGDALANAGEPLEHLLLIYNGRVEVVRPGAAMRELRDGDFVGEMSFIRGGSASADVRCVSETRYIAWPKQVLKDLLSRNPAMDATLQTVFSEDLTRKLAGD